MQRATAKMSVVEPTVPVTDRSLVGLASPIFDTILRIRARYVTPSDDLRRTVADELAALERSAERLGIPERRVSAAKFAVVAFTDETVLTTDFPLRLEWEKYPLQLEYFGVHVAGETFFERLDALVAEAEESADVLEVYYVCLLLGFKGKYKLFGEEQLAGVVARVEDALRRSGRLRAGGLAPHGLADDQPEAVRDDAGIPRAVKLWGSVAVGSVMLLYVVLYALLQSDVRAALVQLNR